jgi:2'-hydroxyisoflavone reductase
MVEGKSNGIYNAIGPDYSLSVSQFLIDCKTASGSNVEFIWISDDNPLNAGVNRWTELPLWIPENTDASGVFSRSNKKAIVAGLKFRPLRETITDTLKWWQTERQRSDLETGLSREREVQLLAQAQA